MSDAQIWTIVSLMVTIFLSFVAFVGMTARDNSKALHEIALNVQRHDFHFERIEQRLDGIDVRLDGIDVRLDGIDSRLDGIDVRLDGIDVRLDGHDGRLDDLKAIGDQLGGQFFKIAKKLDEHLRRRV